MQCLHVRPLSTHLDMALSAFKMKHLCLLWLQKLRQNTTALPHSQRVTLVLDLELERCLLGLLLPVPAAGICHGAAILEGART